MPIQMDGFGSKKMRTFSSACLGFPRDARPSAESEERRACGGVRRRRK